MKFSTNAIHQGQSSDPSTGAVIPPIYQTSTFATHLTDEFDYTRHGNPNFVHFEQAIAAVEGAKYATVFSSGMGAATGLLSVLSQGDRIVLIREVYGGTYRLFAEFLPKFGLDWVLVDERKEEDLLKALEPPTKLVLFESPTNPSMQVIDIQNICNQTASRDCLVAVDNTFASPYFQHPLSLGADIVWHSTTKYIGGHSDLIGGVLVTNDESLKKGFDLARMTLGLNPSPFDCWLGLRGLKTLAVRMEKHQQNVFEVAQYLQTHPKVKRVFFPGFEKNLPQNQMKGFSGMFSAEFDMDLEQMKSFFESLQLFTLAVSLGGVESLINHSYTMSHAPLPEEEKKKLGITQGLARISVGIEDPEDLIEDLKQALEKTLC